MNLWSRIGLQARLRSLLAGAACAACISGCAGNGMGLDESGRPLPPSGTNGGALTADFASIQEHVFTPICTVCHAGGSAPQGLRLDAANSYSLLVGIPSTEVPSILRVKPGDPDNSYLIQKLEGHAAVGAQMPFGGPPLPAATIAVIRQWITDGAQQAATAFSGPAFTAMAVVPATGDVLLEKQTRVILALTQDLDETRIDESSVRLEMMANGRNEEWQPVPVTLAVARGNTRVLIVQSGRTLTDGTYRLAVPPSPATGLWGLAGDRLGGDGSAGASVALTQFKIVVPP